MEFGHSTPDMAADIALRAKAKMLVLFHVSPRYKPIGDTLKKVSVTLSIRFKPSPLNHEIHLNFPICGSFFFVFSFIVTKAGLVYRLGTY